MIKRLNSVNKRSFSSNNSYWNKLINRVILVLVTLLIILIFKVINNKTTNSVIQIIEKNIHYNFSLKEDGKKVKDYLIKTVDNSKDTIQELTGKINKNHK